MFAINTDTLVAFWSKNAPRSDDKVGYWLAALMATYLFVKEATLLSSKRTNNQDLAIVQDAATFAGSILVILGATDAETLKAIGDLRLFLLLIGFAGLRYCWRAVRSS